MSETAKEKMVELTPLAAFAAFLRAECFEEFVDAYTALVLAADIPLMRFFTHLSEAELRAMSVPGMQIFLTDLVEGTAEARAEESLRAWEADELPGISRDSIEPSDLVRVYMAQRRAMVSFLPRYTQALDTVLAVFEALDAYYSKLQDDAFKLFTRLREESAQRAARLEAERQAETQRADALADANRTLTRLYEDLQTAEEEATAQAEELQSQQEELNALYESLQKHTDHLEEEVARRTQELGEEKVLLENVIANVPAGIAFLDANRVFRWVNPAHAAATSLDVDAFTNRALEDIFPIVSPNSRAVTAIASVVASGEPLRASEVPYTTSRDEAERTSYFDVLYLPIRNQGGQVRGVLVFSMDVSDRVEKVQLQQATIERLHDIDRMKDEFLSVISHEMRTPLNFIMGFASLLEDGVAGVLNDEQRRYVTKILSGTDRMLLLVKDLLDYAAMQAGRFKLQPHDQEYDELVEEVLSTMQPLADQSRVQLSADLPPGLSAHVDGSRVVQILTNLVSNAIKFTPKGGTVTIRTRRDDEGSLLTEVIDTGIGIADEDLPKLFMRFHQLNMSVTREAGGTGLGLSITKALVEAHGGTIGVSSSPGVGSTFWFRLPIQASEVPG